MSLDINKSLIENSDYLNQLAKELKGKGVSDLDSNLLYEVAYADTYLDVLLSKSTSKELNSELLDSKLVFDTILSQASYDEVNELQSSFDYKKLLKCKYSNLDEASYEKSYVSNDNMLGEYLKSTAPRFIMMTIMFFCIIGNVPRKLFDIFSAQQAESLPSSAMETFNSMSNAVMIILNLVITLSFMFYCILYTLDIAYIVLPWLRQILEHRENKLVSSEAIKAVEICMGDTVSYKKVKDFNRIQRNKVWLESMLGVLDTQEGFYDLKKELRILSDNIKSMEESGKKGKSYYLSISKIEFLHDKYLQLVC